MATMRYPDFVGRSLAHFGEDEIGETETGGEQDQSDDLETQEEAEGAHISVIDGAEHASTILRTIFFAVLAPSRRAESAGVRVNALKAEMAIEKAMVKANWRKRMPVVPGKKATGTKTATSTSDVAMTAPVTSFMASEAL